MELGEGVCTVVGEDKKRTGLSFLDHPQRVFFHPKSFSLFFFLFSHFFFFFFKK